MKKYYGIILIAIFTLSISRFCKSANNKENTVSFDVIVYGATPSGIAAAVNAARVGVRVALVEETNHVGGLTSSGLSHTDFLTYESLGGTWREFMNRVEQYYIETFGPNSPQVKACWQGAYYEPKVAKQVFTEMLDEQKNIKLYLEHRLVSAHSNIQKNNKIKLYGIRLKNLENDKLIDFEAIIFIDATYEGDLIAAAGCEYTIGSEGPDKYNEPSASPKDWHVQCYNFRVTLTKDPDNGIPIPKPENYDPNEYQILIDGMQNGTINELGDILRGPIRQIPNNKADFNDRKGSKFSLKICNETDVWPEAMPEVRQQIWANGKNHALGLFYFLQHDDRVLTQIREVMKVWNLPKDEYENNDNWPPFIYVREGRRLVGEYVYTEKDGKPDRGSTRAPAFNDAIAIGDYNFNSHGTYFTCGCEDRKLLGNLGSSTRPWQVPYGVLLPKNVEGLLAPVPVSASRVGYGGIRMEPTWTALGQAAGLAAAQAVKNDYEPRDVDVELLQEKLHSLGAITFYTSDVPPGSKYFRVVQYFGNRGLFQDLINPNDVPSKGLKRISNKNENQWHFAFPYHDIQPNKKMQKELAQTWIEKLKLRDENILDNVQNLTRGEFLLQLYEMKK